MGRRARPIARRWRRRARWLRPCRRRRRNGEPAAASDRASARRDVPARGGVVDVLVQWRLFDERRPRGGAPTRRRGRASRLGNLDDGFGRVALDGARRTTSRHRGGGAGASVRTQLWPRFARRAPSKGSSPTRVKMRAPTIGRSYLSRASRELRPRRATSYRRARTRLWSERMRPCPRGLSAAFAPRAQKAGPASPVHTILDCVPSAIDDVDVRAARTATARSSSR